MKRKTLDKVFSVGGVLLALLLGLLAFVLQNQASFAKDYVSEQLTAQRITFTPADKLSPEEKGVECLVANAGQPLTTGAQAECYANQYIGLHLKETNEGKTYAETSTQSRTAAAAAKKANEEKAPDAADLDAAAKALDGKVQTLFRGETLRGLLLTSYGFSIFGERAGQAAMVALGAAIVLLLASIAGFVHAFTTPVEEVVT